MNCRSCGSNKALYQTADGRCQLCPPSTKKVSIEKKRQGPKKRKRTPKQIPIKATGKYCGTVRFFKSIGDTAIAHGRSEKTIRALLTRGSPTNQTPWSFERITIEEYNARCEPRKNGEDV